MTDERATYDDFGEERANYMQRIGALEKRVEEMLIRRSEDGMTDVSVNIALTIEDMFARGGRTRKERLIDVIILIRTAMRQMLEGEKKWNEEWADRAELNERPDTR